MITYTLLVGGMSYRDRLIFEFIRRKSGGAFVVITHAEIAKEFDCDERTSLRVIRRLCDSGLIEPALPKYKRRPAYRSKVDAYAPTR